MSNQLAPPQLYEDNKPVLLNRGIDDTQNIISDFSTDELCYRPNLLYLPPGTYRYISMYHTTPLKQISIEVYWRDKYGFMHPYYLDPSNSASLKLLFKKIK